MKYTRLAVHSILAVTLLAMPCWADDPPVAQPAAADEVKTGSESENVAESKPTAAAAKREEKRQVAPLEQQLEAALKRLTPMLKDKRIMAAAVPHYANKVEHWPAAPAVLNQLLVQLEKQEFTVPARVENLVLGEKATPPQSLIDDLQSQFPFDLLMTADYRRSDKEIDVSLRVFDAKTRKRIHHETLKLGNDVTALGYAKNREVWEYCHKMKGYMVGNGECWTLAASALVESAAQHPYAFQYGDAIAMDDLLVPGDLIQFEGVSIQVADGYHISMGHHTAIVYKNLGGGMIELIHQNGPPLGRYACLLPVNIYSYTGSMFPFRPIPYPAEEEEESTTMIGEE